MSGEYIRADVLGVAGAQIIDLMMLVVDVVKGIQTQTAECLVIGEIACSHLVVVLNKIDLVQPEKREATIAKVSIPTRLFPVDDT
jgi:selenocysteine-specific elongation factor